MSDGQPTVSNLSADPRIELVSGLCDMALCAALAEMAGRQCVRIASAHRRSHVRWCPRGTDENCDRLADLISGWVGLPATHAEPVQLASYECDEYYGLHYDTYGCNSEGNRARERHGERLITAIVYLRAPGGGGATVFPKLDLRIYPQVASALIFNLCREGTEHPDHRCLHRSETVTAGHKVIASIWFHARPFDFVPCRPS